MKKSILVIFGLLFFVLAWEVEAFSLRKMGISGNIGYSLTHQIQRLYLRIPGSKSGQLVLGQVMTQLPKLTTAQVVVQSDIHTFDSDQNKQSSLAFSAQGPVQFQTLTDPDSYNQELQLMLELAMADATLSTDFDFIKYQEKAFFRLNQVPALPALDLKSIKDAWLEIELEELDPTGKQVVSEEDQQQVFSAVETLLQKSQVSRAERQVVGGTPVFSLKLTFSKDDLVAFFESVDSLPASRRQKLEQLDQVQVELLVDAQNYFIRRVSIPLRVEGEQVQAFSTSELDTVGAFSEAAYMEIELVAELSEFNKQVFFEIPTETIKMEDGLLKVLQPLESEDAAAQRPAELSVLSAWDKRQLESIDQSEH